MGRCCMRCVPVIVWGMFCAAKYAVRNRMAVPAAIMSTRLFFVWSAWSMTWVSSQSDRLFGLFFPPASALIMRTLADMLLLAGSCGAAFSRCGAIMVVCMCMFWGCVLLVSAGRS